MSNREYSVAIQLDDSQLNAAIKKLQNAFGAIDVSVGGGGGAATATKENEKRKTRSFERMRAALDKISKNSFQLIGIGIGITALVGLITKSSPMLSAMFKLMQMSVMLILRPIGDFIGFILKPIMMLILTNFILPFYKTVYPIIKEWGPKIGNMLAGFFRDPAGAIKKAIEGIDFGTLFQIPDINIGGALKGLGIFLNSSIIKPIVDFFNTAAKWLNTTILMPIIDFFTTLGIDVAGVLGTAWEKLVKFFEFVNVAVSGGLSEGWTQLVNFFNSIWATVQSILVPAWNVLIQWWSKNSSDINGILDRAWQVFTKFFAIIESDTGGWVLDRWLAIAKFFSILASDATGWVLDRWNDITSLFTSIFNIVKNLWDTISSFSFPSGGGGGSSGSNVHANPWGLASGGVINEPIAGIGLNTKHPYLFGEKGAEVITPLKDAGRTMRSVGGINVIIHVGSVRNDADLDHIVARVIAELQVKQYRLGII